MKRFSYPSFLILLLILFTASIPAPKQINPNHTMKKITILFLLLFINILNTFPGLSQCTSHDPVSCTYISNWTKSSLQTQKFYYSQLDGITGQKMVHYFKYQPSTAMNANPKSPLIIVLHGGGSGTSSDKNDLCTLRNANWFPNWLDEGTMSEVFKSKQVFVINPQLRNDNGVYNSFKPQFINEIIDMAVSSYNVDQTQIYLFGASYGANDVLEYLNYGNWGRRIAAAIAVAPNSATSAANYANIALSGTKLWIIQPEGEEATDIYPASQHWYHGIINYSGQNVHPILTKQNSETCNGYNKYVNNDFNQPAIISSGCHWRADYVDIYRGVKQIQQGINPGAPQSDLYTWLFSHKRSSYVPNSYYNNVVSGATTVCSNGGTAHYSVSFFNHTFGANSRIEWETIQAKSLTESPSGIAHVDWQDNFSGIGYIRAKIGCAYTNWKEVQIQSGTCAPSNFKREGDIEHLGNLLNSWSATIAPNPSEKSAMLLINNAFSNTASVEIYDSKGVQVYSNQNVNTGSELEFGENFAHGLYTVKVTCNHTQKVIKFVKQN